MTSELNFNFWGSCNSQSGWSTTVSQSKNEVPILRPLDLCLPKQITMARRTECSDWLGLDHVDLLGTGGGSQPHLNCELKMSGGGVISQRKSSVLLWEEECIGVLGRWHFHPLPRAEGANSPLLDPIVLLSLAPWGPLPWFWSYLQLPSPFILANSCPVSSFSCLSGTVPIQICCPRTPTNTIHI